MDSWLTGKRWFFMNKIVVLCVALTTCSVSAADDASTADVDLLQIAIHRAGYECARVDRIETKTDWFSTTTSKVTCDNVYQFLLRYERGGISVEVISL